jgi:hypothetical protein
MRLLFLGAAVFLFWNGTTRAEDPTTAPAGEADKAAVKQIRESLEHWNKACADWSLADVRKIYHTENEREATYADYVAHECWEDAKTQKLVRDKWGAEAEAKFAHIFGTDTLEDDLSADITVNGDHATVQWKTKDIQRTPMIKIDGNWVIDIHPIFQDALKNNPHVDENPLTTGKLMKQAATDIKDGKFDDADSFLADFKKNYDALSGAN